MEARGVAVRSTERQIDNTKAELGEFNRIRLTTMGGVAVVDSLLDAPAVPRSSRNNEYDHSTDITPVPRDVDADEKDWRTSGLCTQTDPEAFFPEKGGSTRDAKKICVSCDVREQCLDYALQNDERFGIWGGLSERERRKLKSGNRAS